MVGDDWQAVLLWKALFDAGVYTNVAIHPAVPPGGALLRTSLMATHEREHLDGAARNTDRPRTCRELLREPTPVGVVSGLSRSGHGSPRPEIVALSERPGARPSTAG